MTNFSDFLDLSSFEQGKGDWKKIFNEMLLAVEAFGQGSDNAVNNAVSAMQKLSEQAKKTKESLKNVSDHDAIAKLTKQIQGLQNAMNEQEKTAKEAIKASAQYANSAHDLTQEQKKLTEQQEKSQKATKKQIDNIETYAGEMAKLKLEISLASAEAKKMQKANDDLGFEKASNNVKKLTDRLETLKQKERELKQEQKERAKEESKANKQREKELLAQQNTLEGMRAKLSLLTAKRNTLEIGTEGFDKAQKEIKELNDAISELEQESGDFRRNVGNYKSAIVDAFNETNGFSSGVFDMASGLTDAFAMGGAIGAGVFVLTELASKFGEVSEAISEINTQYSQLSKTLGGTNEDIQANLASSRALFKLYEETDPETFFKGLNQAVRTFGVTGEEATQQFAIAFNKLPFQSQRDELLEGINEYGENIKNLGLDMNTVFALTTKGVQMGVRDVDTVLDLLNNAQIELQRIDVNKDLKEFFNPAQLKQIERFQKNGEFDQILQLTSKRISDLGENSRKAGDLATKVFTAIGEEKGAKNAIRLMRDFDSLTKEYNNSLTDAEKRNLALFEANKKVANAQIELAQKFKGTGKTFQLLSAQAQAFFFDVLLKAFDFFSERFDNFKNEFDTITELFNELGEESGLSDLLEGLQKAGEEIVKTLGIIIDVAVQLGAGVFKNFINQLIFVKDLIDGFLGLLGTDLFEVVKTTFDAVVDTIQGVFSSIGLIFETLGRNIENFRNAIQTIRDFFPQFLQAIQENPFVKEITKDINDFINTVNTKFNEVTKMISDFFESLGIAETFRNEFSKIAEIFDFFSNETEKAGSDFQRFTDILSSLFKGGIGVGLIRTVALIGDAISTLFEQILNRTGDFAEAFTLVLKGDFEGASQLFSDTIDDIQKSSGDAIFASFEESLAQVTGQVDEQTKAVEKSNEANTMLNKTTAKNTESTKKNTIAKEQNAEAEEKLAKVREDANKFLEEQNNQLESAQIELLKAQGKEREAFIKEQNQKEIEIQKEFNEEIAKIEELRKSGGFNDEQAQEARNTVTKEFLASQELLTLESNQRLEELEKQKIDNLEKIQNDYQQKIIEGEQEKYEFVKLEINKEVALREQQYLTDIQNDKLSKQERSKLDEEYQESVKLLKNEQIEQEIEHLTTLNSLNTLNNDERIANETKIIELKNELLKQDVQNTKEAEQKKLDAVKSTLSTISDLSKMAFEELNNLNESNADAEINSLNSQKDARQQNLNAQVELAKATSTSEIDFATENAKIAEIEAKKLSIEKKRVRNRLLLSLLESGVNALTASDKVAGILAGIDNIQSKKEGGFIEKIPFFGGGNTFKGSDNAETLVKVHGNEFMMNANQVRKYPDIANFLDADLQGKVLPIPDFGDARLLENQSKLLATYSVTNHSEPIDYTRLGNELHDKFDKALQKNKHGQENIYDSQGELIGVSFLQGNQRQNKFFDKKKRVVKGLF